VIVSTDAELDALYGAPVPAALTKEVDRLNAPYRALIAASPFVVVATVGPEGLDCTPRGDPAGFVRVVDDVTLHLPDRRGNNRIDSLRNLIRDPRISLLFLIPGVGETLRVNGTARILADVDLCAAYTMEGKPPKTVIEIAVGRVYFQCPKALVRSHLWDVSRHIDRAALPSAGDMLSACATGGFDGAAFDAAYPERLTQTIY
jgi:PPOX class probable FMN-dependent enzyme